MVRRVPSALTSDSSLTNHPESVAAQELIDARLPDQNSVDEFIVVRSERAVAEDTAFETRVRALADDLRRSGAVQEVTTYLDPEGEGLVSADRHATVLPVVVPVVIPVVPVVQPASVEDARILRCGGYSGTVWRISGDRYITADHVNGDRSCTMDGTPARVIHREPSITCWRRLRRRRR